MWQGIQGHDSVIDQFRHSQSRGRLAASYLFLGPSGVGKRLFAIKLAQALLCKTGSEQLEPCGNCESCQLFEAGNHPDLDVVGLPTGKRWLPVDLFIGDRDHRNQVGLCHNISLRPQMGRRRVAIIDDADYLTTESANCLLKTLEEPPSGAVIILIGTSRGRQLPTILSRTQTIRFAPLSEEIVRRLVLEQQIASDEPQAAQIATASEGSLSKAKELVDPELLQKQQELVAQLTPSRFNSVRLASELVAFVNQAGKEADLRRQRLRSLIQMVANNFRQVLRSACSGDVSTSSLHPVCNELGPAAQDCALAILDRCLEAELQLDRNANQATLLECWLDDLATTFASCHQAAKS